MIYAYIALWGLTILFSVAENAGAINLETMEPPLLTGAAAIVIGLAVLTMIVSIIVVGMWIHRAHANLKLAGIHDNATSPSWAVGWFFIPIANLFKPFQAMRELWTSSHGVSDRYGDEAGGPLPQWWGCWIVGNVLTSVSSRVSSLEGSTSKPVYSVVDIVGFLALIGAAWFLLKIVEGINSAQQSSLGIAKTFA